MADIFRHRGAAWRASHAGQVSLGQLKVVSAIERCRTAALGGHVERCEACAHLRISDNSCRNRHCPSAKPPLPRSGWPSARPNRCPCPISMSSSPRRDRSPTSPIRNKAVIYDLLLKAAAETLITIAPTGQARGLKAHDPKHLGARIGLTAVRHTWGSALTHHPHAQIIVPGGGFSPKPAPARAGANTGLPADPACSNGGRAENIARARQLLNAPAPHHAPSDADSIGDSEPQALSHPRPCCGGRMIIIEIFERGRTAISPDGSKPGRQLMIVIARSRRPNAAHSCRSSSAGGEPARPMTTVRHRLTASAMAIATRSSLHQAPPPRYPAVNPIWRSRSPRRSRLLAALKSP